MEFKQTEYYGLAVKPEQCPQDGLPEIILSGRSNVGKSTLVNGLARRRNIARTSRTPGKTRQILFFKVDELFYLVDLPGYGHAVASKKDKKAFAQLADDYLGSQRPMALILLLLDIRISPTVQDRQMLHWLEESGHPWQILLTKADKLSRSAARQRQLAIAAELDLVDAEELLVISAQAGTGLDELRSLIGQAVDQYS